MAYLTNISFEFSNEIFTEDAFQLLLYHGAKKSKLTKTQIKGGGGPTNYKHVILPVTCVKTFDWFTQQTHAHISNVTFKFLFYSVFEKGIAPMAMISFDQHSKAGDAAQ